MRIVDSTQCAGARVDAIGLRSWQLPPELFAEVVTRHPRHGVKQEFVAALRTESALVLRGRVWFLRRDGAFGLAIAFAPFPS
ncbi:MAG: hypothetical protein LH603_12070 [Pseudonocardia sp.]|nr:hypothetical protein [Pseudonocardia sp.]